MFYPLRSSLVLLLVAAAPALAFAEPVRVATLLPFVSQAVEASDGKATLVASVRRSMHETPREGIADLGTPHAPNFEMLFAANPDVIVTNKRMHATLRDKLARTKAEVFELDTTSVASTLKGLQDFGVRIGASEALTTATAKVESDLAAARLAQPRKALTIFVAPGTPMVVTGRTWIGDLIGSLGFEDVAAPYTGGAGLPAFAPLSDEVLSVLEPEVVLIVAHGQSDELRDAFLERMNSEPAWKRAAKSAGDRVYVLEPHLFSSNPGLDLPKAANWLVTQVQEKPPVASGP